MTSLIPIDNTPVGINLIVNLYNIFDKDLLNSLSAGRPILDSLVSKLNLHTVAIAEHQFHPIGYTIAYVLSESHFTIHTYPEYKSCYIDIFCCNDKFNAQRALKEIKETFKTESATYFILYR